MLVTIRTSRLALRNLPVRSTVTVCGRPTGMPMSSMTVRQFPLASFTCNAGRVIVLPPCDAATLSLDQAYQSSRSTARRSRYRYFHWSQAQPASESAYVHRRNREYDHDGNHPGIDGPYERCERAHRFHDR